MHKCSANASNAAHFLKTTAPPGGEYSYHPSVGWLEVQTLWWGGGLRESSTDLDVVL